MLEDIRDHSSVPTAQETEWLEARPFAAVARVLALALVAAAIVSIPPAMEAAMPAVAAAVHK